MTESLVEVGGVAEDVGGVACEVVVKGLLNVPLQISSLSHNGVKDLTVFLL